MAAIACCLELAAGALEAIEDDDDDDTLGVPLPRRLAEMAPLWFRAAAALRLPDATGPQAQALLRTWEKKLPHRPAPALDS